MNTIKDKIYKIIFESDSTTGKAFDLILLVAILASVAVAMLETVPTVSNKYGRDIYLAEWFFTAIFTIEYILRIYSSRRSRNYIFSFFGIIDFISIIPTYLSLIFPGTQSLIIIRSIRLLRIFRILKLAQYLGEANILITAMKASRIKVTVFIGAVAIVVSIVGTLMYLIEGPEHGFTSVPVSTYWAIVTVTTVGFGDITPQTPVGQFLASFLMILGYGFIAVPTGIVSVEIANAQTNSKKRLCSKCGKSNHASSAMFCDACGESLANSKT